MIVESEIAVFKSSDASGMWAPVCPEAEYRYYRWLVSLLATGQKLMVENGLAVDRCLNVFEVDFAKKDRRYGRETLITCSLEHPILGISLKDGIGQGEVRFWSEQQIDFVRMDQRILAMALRQIWGDPQTMAHWYYESCEQAVEGVESIKLRSDLQAIFRRRDAHWMLDSINLMLRKLVD